MTQFEIESRPEDISNFMEKLLSKARIGRTGRLAPITLSIGAGNKAALV
jgi:hypothetical protein